MIIDNVDALRDWLTKYLEPLCDADPIALAKYVMALIKKDKPEKDLKTVCMDQLEVFLQQKTITFVDTLFETISNKSYLKAANNSSSTSSTPPSTQSSKTSTQTTIATTTTTTTSEQSPVSSTTVSDTASTVRKSPEEATNSGVNKTVEPTVTSTQTQANAKVEPSHESSYKAKDTKRNRSRSRSRSPVRPRRGDFDSRRLGNPNRNGAYYPDDRRNRRGVGNRRAGNQRYGGYRNDRNDRDHRRGPRDLKRGRSRSRSYSSGSSRSRSRSRSWSKERDRESPSNKKSRPSSRPSSRSPSPSKLTKEEKSKKCRDYEEKGFCLKGHLCPYDHGNDPVVLDTNVSAALFNNNNQGPNAGPIMPLPNTGIAPNAPNTYLAEPYNPEAPGMEPQRSHPPQGHPMGPRMPPPYWPPHMHMRGPIPGHPLPPPQFMPPPGRPRELIGVPTIDNNLRHSQPLSNRTVIEPNIPMGMRGGMRGGMKHMGRGGYRNVRRIPNDSADKTCLEVRKIPPNLNTISHLNEHFSKFGNIVNLQVKHEGDPEAALVQYTTHGEALAAIRSTEAVLNNRFIKVFWHSKELQQKHELMVGPKPDDQTEEGESGASKLSIKDRLGPKLGDTEGVLTAVNASGTISRTVFDRSKLKKNNTINNNNNNNNQTQDNTNSETNSQTIPETTNSATAPKKNDKNNKKEILGQQVKLLEEMIGQQKQLTAKLEKSTNDNEKKVIKDTIELIGQRIGKISEGMKELTRKNTAKVVPTKKQLNEEILDADLDLFVNLQNKNLDPKQFMAMTNNLANKLKKVKSLVARGRGKAYPRRGHGLTRRGSFYGRGANSLHKVDRRTRKLLIPNIKEDDHTDLLEHLAQFSDVELIDSSTNGAVVTFKTRMDAEKAIQNMSQIKFKDDCQLSYSWFDENLNKALNMNEINKSLNESKSENETDDNKVDSFGVPEEEILDFEEVEEEDTEDESEARNWKA